MADLFDFAEIGLSHRDKKVYETLVAHPGSSLRSIAAATEINRGSVYESIKQLVDVGLVGSIEVGKQRRYSASEPHTILELLHERQAQAALAERTALAYIATLPSPTAVGDVVPFATYYEDLDGVAAILRDVIVTCKKQPGRAYRVISTKRVRDHMYQNFRNFTQRRIAAGIAVRALAVGSGGAQDDLSERKWLNAERGEAPNCYTLIYGDKTAFITISDTNVLSGIVIDNPGVAHLQKELFDHLWQTT